MIGSELERTIADFVALCERFSTFEEGPDTTLRVLKQKVESQLEELSADPERFEQVKNEFLALLDEAPTLTADTLTKHYLGLSKAKSVEEHWLFVTAAHEKIPFSPLTTLMEPESWRRATIRASVRLEETLGARTEKDCIAFLGAFSFVVEEVFWTYLIKLRNLLQIREGKPPTRPPGNNGALPAEVDDLMGERLFVSWEITELRNAISHGHYDYQGDGNILLWNDALPWKARKNIEDLENLAERALDFAIGLGDALATFNGVVVTELYEPVLPVFPQLLRGELSEEETARISAEYLARQERIYSGIPKALWKVFGTGERRVPEYP